MSPNPIAQGDRRTDGGTDDYELPAYGTVAETILLDAPKSEFTVSDLVDVCGLTNSELGGNIAHLTSRGFVEVADEHNHWNTYRLSETGREAQETLLEKYGLNGEEE